MDNFDLTRSIVALSLIIITIIFLLFKTVKFKHKLTIKTISRAAIFAALSAILYIIPYLKISLPIFPAFLEIHLDEVPIFIAGFAYGPSVGTLVLIVKTLIKLPMTTTLCVGELTDFLYSLVFILPATLIYKRKRNIKSALLGLSIGTLIQVVVSSFFTTFVVLNFYMFVMGLSKETILMMVNAANPMVTSLDWPFLLIIALPFNFIKDIVVIALTFLIYKSLHKIIDRIIDKTA